MTTPDHWLEFGDAIDALFGLNAVASERTLRMLEEATEKVRMWLGKIAELGG